jgi:endoglucanase
MALPRILKDLFTLPTASFRESAVLDYLADACGKLVGVQLKYDRYGNLLAHYRRGSQKIPPLAFVAHTDHPGFVALEMVDNHTLRAAFRGGVRPEFFADAKVRLFDGAGWIKGRVLEITQQSPPPAGGGPSRPEEVLVRVRGTVEPGAPGMWDLPDPVLRGDRVLARDCDDLAGVGAMVTLLQRLVRKHARGEVYCLFTRAEELGFIGALGAARAETLPKHMRVISVETSSALPHAPIGGGVIIRVGDRSAVYPPELTSFCLRVAQQLAKRRRGFAFQRKLMDGGACEANAFLAHGYTATGICLALGNYHNMDIARRKIGSEYVSLRDWQGMVNLFEALVLDEQGPDVGDTSLAERLDKLFKKYETQLEARE